MVVVVVAVVGGGAFPGECPLPPGFSWDLRMKPPFWPPPPSPHPVPRTPSTILWEYWESVKRVGRGTSMELHEREWMTGRTRGDRYSKDPPVPPSLRASPRTPAGGSVWRWHPSVYPRSGVGRRRGRRPGWNGRAGLPRTLGSTKRTSASVNYPLRRPLAEFMRPSLEEVSRLFCWLRRGVGMTRADRSLAIGKFYERLHWRLDGTFSIPRRRNSTCHSCLQMIFYKV